MSISGYLVFHYFTAYSSFVKCNTFLHHKAEGESGQLYSDSTRCSAIVSGSTMLVPSIFINHIVPQPLTLHDLLRGPQEHRQTHGNTREPLLENITSEYDLELFRKAQARASEDLVIGQRLLHHCYNSVQSLNRSPWIQIRLIEKL